MPARIRRAAQRNSQIRRGILNKKANELAGIFVSAQETIANLLLTEAGQEPFTASRVEALSSQIDLIVSRELTQPGTAWVEANVPELYNVGITQGARTYTSQTAATVFDQVPSARVRETFLNFTRGPTYAGILQDGFRNWLGEIQRTDVQMVDSIRRTLTEGTIAGLSNNEIVENLLVEGQIKPLILDNGRKISAETRARGLVRTEGLRSINQAEISANTESGLNAYVDVGTRDEVTSGICRVAQRQVPHTLSWWQKSPLGIPPRHIQNCRDELMGIIIEDFTAADARALGIRGYNPLTFQLDDGNISPGETKRLEKEIREAEAAQRKLKSSTKGGKALARI